ncbi:nuclease-related domain-containing protein [Psychrobacillus vulpis]|nr:nuclease-related domain-containing protein [Psychrobacillus vulpis]
MIAKKYSVSLYFDALRALHKRLPKNHSKFFMIQNEYRQKVAGELGEEAVMQVMGQVKLPYKFYVFHNLSLYSESLFQMDVLIISPYYALIFEEKNIKGEITFTEQQLTRKLDTNESHSFDNPVIQLEEYEYQLNLLFQTRGISIPIYSALVFAFASRYIKTPPTHKTVLFRKGIKPFLRNIKTGTPLLTEEQLNTLKNDILHANEDFNPFPLCEHFQIQPESLIKGVECVQCGFIGMKKVKHNWFCPRCKIYHKRAHEQSLKDYFLICKSTMSNMECQQFLQLNNKHEATRILKNEMLLKTGRSRNTKYSAIFLK